MPKPKFTHNVSFTGNPITGGYLDVLRKILGDYTNSDKSVDYNALVQDVNNSLDEWYKLYQESGGSNYQSRADVNPGVLKYQKKYKDDRLNNFVVRDNENIYRRWGGTRDRSTTSWEPDGIFGAQTYLRRRLPFLQDSSNSLDLLDINNWLRQNHPNLEAYLDENGVGKLRILQDGALRTEPAWGKAEYPMGYWGRADRPMGYTSPEGLSAELLDDLRALGYDPSKHEIIRDANGNPVLGPDGKALFRDRQPEDTRKWYVKGLDWLKNELNKPYALSDLEGLGRVLFDNYHNTKNTREYLNLISPNLRKNIPIYKNTTGNYALQLAMNAQAADIEHKANIPFTSDARATNLALIESTIQANKLRSQGNMLDNEAIQKTSELAWQQTKENLAKEVEVANYNTESMNKTRQYKAQIWANLKLQNIQNWDKYFAGIQSRHYREALERDAALKALKLKAAGWNLPDYSYQIQQATSRYYNATPGSPEALAAYNEIIGLLKKLAKQQLEVYRRIYGPFDRQTEDWLKSSDLTVATPTYHKNGAKIKFQSGGGLNLVEWTPLDVGSSRSSGTSSSSASSVKKNGSDDLSLKDLINTVKSIKGLNNDVHLIVLSLTTKFSALSGISDRYSLFGDSSTGISQSLLVQLYLSAIDQINIVRNNAERYKAAYENAKSKNALNEIAIGSDGKVFVRSLEGYEQLSPTEYLQRRGEVRALTNSELLYLRENDPSLAFNDEIASVVNSGIGYDQMVKQIDQMVGNLGTDTSKEFLFVPKEGLKILQALGTGQVAKVTQLTKTQLNQMLSALKAISLMLPSSVWSKLIIEAGGVKEANELLLNIITKKASTTRNLEAELYEYDENGKLIKTSSKKSGSGGASEEDKMLRTPYLDMITGRAATDHKIVLNLGGALGNGEAEIAAKHYALYDQSGKIIPRSSLSTVLNSGIGGLVTDPSAITFGDQHVKKEEIDRIVYDGTGAERIIAPKNVDGSIRLEVIKEWAEINKEVLEEIGSTESPEDRAKFEKRLYEKAEEKYPELLPFFNEDQSIDMSKCGIFLAMTGYFNDAGHENRHSDWIKNENGNDLVEQILESTLSTKAGSKVIKYDADTYNSWLDWLPFRDWNNIYSGTIFIPITTSETQARNADKTGTKSGVALEMEASEAIRQKLDEAILDNQY